MKFVGEDGEIDVDAYRHACRVTITAQEILVDNASYPTPKIEENSHRFRPLGLGYANLGALLMSRGLAYDSPDGQAYAAALTSIMTAEAYRQSAVIARDHGGPFVEFEKNREPFMHVIDMHRDAARRIPADGVPAAAPGHGPRAVGRDLRARRAARLPQRADHPARADRLPRRRQPRVDRPRPGPAARPGQPRRGQVAGPRPPGRHRRRPAGGNPLLRQRRRADRDGRNSPRIPRTGHHHPPDQGGRHERRLEVAPLRRPAGRRPRADDARRDGRRAARGPAPAAPRGVLDI